MAYPSNTLEGIVLKRTNFKESDVIVTLLAQDGSQVRAVAKGARKPKSPFASRLELFSHAEVYLYQGRAMATITEARLVEPYASLRKSVEASICASVIVDFLYRSTAESLPVPRLFSVAQSALSALSNASAASGVLITAAFLLKALAFEGYRPVFDRCAFCDKELFDSENKPALTGDVTVAFAEGGSVCSDCASSCSVVSVTYSVALWSHHALYSTFAELREEDLDLAGSLSVLRIAQSLIASQLQIRMKSLDFLFTFFA